LKRKKEKKESDLSCVGFKRSQVFLIKYDPHGWRFYQKPVGLELYFLKPELNFTFFCLFFCRMFLILFFGNVLMEGATDAIRLECSGAKLAEQNGMKRYCGCNSPDERRKRACEDEGKEA
jgi:hypothetical protein